MSMSGDRDLANLRAKMATQFTAFDALLAHFERQIANPHLPRTTLRLAPAPIANDNQRRERPDAGSH